MDEPQDDAESAGVDEPQDNERLTGIPTGEAATIRHAEQIERGTLRSGHVRKLQQPMAVQAPNDCSLLNYAVEELEHTALTQCSVKKGLQVFNRDGAEAVLSKMRQLDDRSVIEPVKAPLLTRQEKKDALEHLMFLKKKRCGRIKGRGCADGRKQRMCKTKDDTSLPAVSTDGLFPSCVIDAKERRVVVTCDIPGAFMQADMDEVAHMRLAGPLATLLMRVNSNKCSKHIMMEGGKPEIYVRLSKALCGTLQAALIFWKDLTGKLQEWGFEMNPYDQCVANKMINGKQCTMLWYVDDLKISHIEGGVVEEIINLLNKRYRKEAPLTAMRGKVRKCLGMTIDYSEDVKVAIRMDDYVAGILEEASSDMDGEAPIPAAEYLHDVRQEGAELLSTDDHQHLHTMTAKLLFLSWRARPDIQEAVAFLTTMVKSADKDKDNYKKLGRAIRYLRSTPTLALTLEADNTHIIK